jgi:hypothetical protein
MPTQRGANLLSKDPAIIGRVALHPLQLQACKVVEELIEALRTLEMPADYYDFQVALFHRVHDAQVLQAEASKNLKRQRSRKMVPDAPSGDWEVELAVADRIVKQLRSVGDALAWRAFGYDRRYILALSRNDPVSPIVGNVGLGYEISEVIESWKQDHTFALLHDLTNCLRIGDMTKFTDEGPRLLEKKKQGAQRISPAQLKRMQDAIDVINSGAPLQSRSGRPLELFVATQPFKTHLKQVGEALAIADRDGMSSIRLGQQWVVSCLAATSSPLSQQEHDQKVGEWYKLREKSFQKGNMQASQHHLRGVNIDSAGADPAIAPHTIYPFTPDVCARLTCDLLLVESVVTWDRFAAALEDEGFITECPLPETDETAVSSSAPVLIAHKGGHQVTIHGFGATQFLNEFINLKAYAAGVNEAFLQSLRGASMRVSGVLTFSNEQAVWR